MKAFSGRGRGRGLRGWILGLVVVVIRRNVRNRGFADGVAG